MLQDLTISELSTRLASGNPPPGGGSAAALNAMLGVATMQMAADGVDAEAHLQLQNICKQLGTAAELDANALQQLLLEYRTDALSQSTVLEAARVPLETARCCLVALEVGQSLASRIAEHTVGDFLIGVLAVHAALQGSLLAVGMNLPLLEDRKAMQEFKAEMKRVDRTSQLQVVEIKGQFPLFDFL